MVNLGDCLVGIPSIVRYSVKPEQHVSPVPSTVAVEKQGQVLTVLYRLQETCYLLVFRWALSVQRYREISKSERFRYVAIVQARPEVDYGLNAVAAQALQASQSRRAAYKDTVVYTRELTDSAKPLAPCETGPVAVSERTVPSNRLAQKSEWQQASVYRRL